MGRMNLWWARRGLIGLVIGAAVLAGVGTALASRRHVEARPPEPSHHPVRLTAAARRRARAEVALASSRAEQVGEVTVALRDGRSLRSVIGRPAVHSRRAPRHAALTRAAAILAGSSAERNGANEITSPSVSLSTGAASTVNVAYTVSFTTELQLPAGSTITLNAPHGTLWPSNRNDYALTDATTPSGSFSSSDGASAVSPALPDLPVYTFLSYSGSTDTITLPNAISAGDQLTLVVTGVTNPPAGTDAMTVTTSADTSTATTGTYTITAAQAPSSPTLSLSSDAAVASGVTYTVGLTTSSSGALPAGSTITLQAPAGTEFSSNPCTFSVTDETNADGDSSCASASIGTPGLPVFGFAGHAGTTATITLSNAVAAGDQLSITAEQVTNPPTGSGTLAVSTSSDTIPASTAAYTVAAAQHVTLSPATVATSSDAASAGAVTDTVDFTTSSSGALDGGDSTITLQGPAGTLFPSSACSYQITDITHSGDDIDCPGVSVGRPGLAVYNYADHAGSTVTIDVPSGTTIPAGDQLSVAVSGVQNPAAGSYSVAVSTSSDTVAQDATLMIGTAHPVSTPTVALSSNTAKATSNYTVGFSTNASTGALARYSTITLLAPPGTQWPTGSCDYSLTDSTNGNDSFTCVSGPPTVGDGGAAATFSLPNPIGAGDSLSLAVTGVTNPSAGTDTLQVVTGSDVVPSTSASYSITGSSSTPTQVSAVALSQSTTAGGASGVTDTVTLTTDEALTGGAGSITLAAPTGTIFSACDGGCGGGGPSYDITDATHPSGTGEANSTSVLDGGSMVTVTVPDTIDAGDTIHLQVTGVTNAPPGSGSLEVSTSADQQPAPVTDDTNAPAQVTGATLSTTTKAAGATGVTYVVGFTTSATQGAVAGEISESMGDAGSITLVGVPGTLFGTCGAGCGDGNATYTIDDLTHSSGSGAATPVYNPDDQAEVDLIPDNTIQAGDQITITITQVVNPPAGAGSLEISTSSDTTATPVADPTTAPQQVSGASLSTTSAAGGANGVAYTVQFTTSSSGGLAGDPSASGAGGEISLTAPTGTIFGSCPYGCAGGNAVYSIDDLSDSNDSGLATPVTDPDDLAQVDLVPSKPIGAGNTIKLTATHVTNPPAGTGTLQVSTSSDPAPVSTTDDTVAPAAVSDASVQISSTTPGASATYVAGLTTSANGELIGGSVDNSDDSSIALVAPLGTTFNPSPPDGPVTITDNTNPADSSSDPNFSVLDNGRLLEIFPSNTIPGGDPLTITVPDVLNPPSDVGALAISTSSDPTLVSATAGAPTNVTAVAGDASATVSWTAPTGVSGITGYTVTPYVGSTAQTPYVTTSTATSATIGGLTNGTAYTFTVSAQTNNGSTPQSAPSNAVTPSAGGGGGGGGGGGSGGGSGGSGGGSGSAGIALSTSVLGFGTVGTGQQQAMTVTASSSGSDALALGSASIGGANAGDYAITVDTCSHASLNPGSACTVTVTFRPSADGTRTATLSLPDNASGSPQTVALTGVGTTQATLSGTITRTGGDPVSGARIVACVLPGDDDCQTATTGLLGAYQLVGLKTGARNLEVLPPSTDDLSAASAHVTLVAGSNTQDFTLSAPMPIGGGVGFVSPGGTQSSGVPVVNAFAPFAFDVPVNLPTHGTPNSVTILPVAANIGLNPGDGTDGGFSMSAAAAVGVSYDANGNATGIGGVDEALGSGSGGADAGSDAAVASPSAHAAGLPAPVGWVNTLASLLGLIPQTSYPAKTKNPGDAGTLRYITSTIPLPYQASVTVTIQVHEIYDTLKNRSESTPDHISMQVYRFEVHQPIGDLCDEAFRAFRDAFPTLVAAIKRYYEAQAAAGSHSVLADAASSSPSTGGTYDSLSSFGQALATAEIQSLDAATQAEEGTSETDGVTGSMTAQVLDGGVPIEQVPATDGVVPLTAGRVQVQFDAPSMDGRVHGAFQYGYDASSVSISISTTAPTDVSGDARGDRAIMRADDDDEGATCPNPNPNPNPPNSPPSASPISPSTPSPCPSCGGGGGYIDPSGEVRTRGGVPVAGAKVTLEQAASRHAHARPVPDGSAIMSPANRRNADRTNLVGGFGWDVLPGFYRVLASHAGCSSATTKVHRVPPPVTDLSLVLSCPGRHRRASSLSVTVSPVPGGGTVMAARVRTRGGGPVGYVTFRAGGRRLGSAAVNGRTGMAVLFVRRTRSARSITGRYSGDSRAGPSQARGLARKRARSSRAGRHRRRRRRP